MEIINKKTKMVNYNNSIKFWERVFTRMIDEGFADLFLKTWFQKQLGRYMERGGHQESESIRF